MALFFAFTTIRAPHIPPPFPTAPHDPLWLLHVIIHPVCDRISVHGALTTPTTPSSMTAPPKDPLARLNPCYQWMFGRYPLQESLSLVRCPHCSRVIREDCTHSHLRFCSGRSRRRVVASTSDPEPSDTETPAAAAAEAAPELWTGDGELQFGSCDGPASRPGEAQGEPTGAVTHRRLRQGGKGLVQPAGEAAGAASGIKVPLKLRRPLSHVGPREERRRAMAAGRDEEWGASPEDEDWNVVSRSEGCTTGGYEGPAKFRRSEGKLVWACVPAHMCALSLCEGGW